MISIRLIKESNIGVPGKYFTGMPHAFGNKVAVAFFILVFYPVNDQFNFSFQNDTPLGGMAMSILRCPFQSTSLPGFIEGLLTTLVIGYII
jgi:hypothetical protein